MASMDIIDDIFHFVFGKYFHDVECPTREIQRENSAEFIERKISKFQSIHRKQLSSTIENTLSTISKSSNQRRHPPELQRKLIEFFSFSFFFSLIYKKLNSVKSIR